MTNLISTTLVEVTKNIHDGLITPNVKVNHMSSCRDKDILNNVIFALKMPLLS